MAEVLVKATGVYCLGFAVFHLLFWRLFNWKEDLRSLSFLNRAIMQVLNLCLTFAFVLFGYIGLVHTDEMVGTSLGRSLLAWLALFWLLRAVEQAVFFKLRHWGSWAFLVVFVIGSGLYAAALVTAY